MGKKELSSYNIHIFYMKWHIWDFPDNIYIRFNDNYRLKIYKQLLRQFGTTRKISKALNYDLRMIHACLNKGRYNSKYIAYISLKVLKRIMNLIQIDKYEMERNIICYRCRIIFLENEIPSPFSCKKYNPSGYSPKSYCFEYLSSICMTFSCMI